MNKKIFICNYLNNLHTNSTEMHKHSSIDEENKSENIKFMSQDPFSILNSTK